MKLTTPASSSTSDTKETPSMPVKDIEKDLEDVYASAEETSDAEFNLNVNFLEQSPSEPTSLGATPTRALRYSDSPEPESTSDTLTQLLPMDDNERTLPTGLPPPVSLLPPVSVSVPHKIHRNSPSHLQKIPKLSNQSKHNISKRTPTVRSATLANMKPKRTLRAPGTMTRIKDWCKNFTAPGRQGKMQLRCFLMTFMAYGSTYMLRNPVGVIRNDIRTELNIPVAHLGWMDTAMLLPLAVIQIALSGVQLNQGPRKLIGFALIGAALSMLLFGFFHSYGILLVCLFFSGAFQALVFPQCINALSQWYTDPKVRTTVFGVWGACSALGGLIATALATAMRNTFGWHHVYWIPCIATTFVGLVVLKFMRLPSGTSSFQLSTLFDNNHKEDDEERVGQSGNESGMDGASDQEMLLSGDTYAVEEMRISLHEEQLVEQAGSFTLGYVSVSRTIPVSQLIAIPLVKEMASIYFFVNILRFAVYMWLSIFLHVVVGYSKMEAGWITMAYETGALIGVPGLAILSDKLLNGKKIVAIQFALAFSAGSLFAFYATSGWGRFVNCLFLIMAGFASGGLDMVLTGSVAVDLGGKYNCITGIAGIINGFGVLGAVIQGGLIANVFYLAGQTGVAITLGILGILPILLISRVKRLNKKSKVLLPFMRGRNDLSTPTADQSPPRPRVR